MMLNQKGFTLMELLVAMSLSVAVLGAARTVYKVQAHTVKAQEYQMEAEEYGRVSLDMMAREIRNLGYFPTRTPCTTSPANTSGIATATATSISFAYDANGDGDCADTGENITYTYDPATLNISRTADGSTQTLTNGNVTAFELIYYPKQTGASAPSPYCNSAGSPSGCSGNASANLANIQRVSVSLTVKLLKTDKSFDGSTANAYGQHDVAMSTNVDLRNRF
jgi:prepilin-type N-terminal cleavage/methylation domain-containing protein